MHFSAWVQEVHSLEQLHSVQVSIALRLQGLIIDDHMSRECTCVKAPPSSELVASRQRHTCRSDTAAAGTSARQEVVK